MCKNRGLMSKDICMLFLYPFIHIHVKIGNFLSAFRSFKSALYLAKRNDRRTNINGPIMCYSSPLKRKEYQKAIMSLEIVVIRVQRSVVEA
jgi:hypothetical protein